MRVSNEIKNIPASQGRKDLPYQQTYTETSALTQIMTGEIVFADGEELNNFVDEMRGETLMVGIRAVQAPTWLTIGR